MLFGENESLEQVSYSQYQQFLADDNIESAIIQKTQSDLYEFNGTLKTPVVIERFDREKKIEQFTTQIGVLDNETQQKWDEAGIEIQYKESDSLFWGTILNMLPLILLFVLLIFLFRRMQGGGGQKGIFSFGKARIKLMNEGQPKVTFNDVAGADEAKYELEEIIEFLKEPSKFKKLGGKIPRGVLLLGPPGTGKTLLARAVAGEAGVPFFSMSGADFVEMFVGVGASRVRDLFEQATRNSPCIVFIDEIDAVGRQRGAGLGGGHDEREQTLNQLLVEMDGFEQNSGVIIIAATNRPDVLDPALLRPGRFDRQVVVDRPDVKGREGIFKVHTSKIPLGEDVDLEILSKGTPGLSGADIANIVNEAALLAARRNSEKVTMYDFENAKDKILMGVERKSMVLSPKEKEITAYHEMGHALVSILLESLDPVHKVTIIPRGRALGVTSYLPSEEYHSKSRSYLKTMLAMMMGGRAAEKIIFDIRSTGAASDIERATNIARKMVTEWGMSEKIGPIKFSSEQDDVFLGKEFGHVRANSEKTAQEIDEEVKRIVLEANHKAETILTENIDLLHKTSKVLLDREILDAEELSTLLKGEELPPISKAKIEALKHLNKQPASTETTTNQTQTETKTNNDNTTAQ
ncbi:MAG: ATP-dependent zinc metalloprotease FtsH [Candidatus Kapaibacteriales bacterium]